MRAMILAAGRGERLRPLTDTCPKPLVKVAGKPLLEYHIENLKKAGITEIVINLAHLGEQIQSFVGNGKKWDVDVVYSKESPVKEVGGGILQALPFLGEKPFVVINGDIWTDYPYEQLPKTISDLAHLVLVKNPLHNSQGDYALLEDGRLSVDPSLSMSTYCGISVLNPALFEGCTKGSVFRLRPLLDKALALGKLKGEYYPGKWTDVGTHDRLTELEVMLSPPQGVKC